VTVLHHLLYLTAAGALVASGTLPALTATPIERVSANDNTVAAGTRESDVTTVRLRAARGSWQPEGDAGPTLRVEALGEHGKPLTVPAPLLRVVEGTTIVASIRNDLTSPLRVHGLCARDGNPCAPLDVPPGAEREVRFASGRAGTYHYWATAMGAPIPFREMGGAFVVDPAGVPVEPDRIFVITEWSDLTPAQLRDVMLADDPSARFLAANPKVTFVINGLSWPATERLAYRVGDPVRWRVVNLSSQTHPMHLHGFYFTVKRLGDGLRDAPAAGPEGRRVVTQMVPGSGTLEMEWTPERAGNWLFHCHVMSHVAPERRLGATPSGDPAGGYLRDSGQDAGATDDGAAGHGPHAAHAETRRRGGAHVHDPNDPSLGMAGMVLGITVTDRDDAPTPAPPATALPATATRATATPVAAPPATATPRQLTMTIRGASADGRAAAGIEVTGDGVTVPAPVASPGPPVVLRRGEPVEITLVNDLAESTSMHWHGLELDSYYDGVHGWSGLGAKVAPMIVPGERFTVRITPPRTGTFIYHTHLHDYRQLSSGLYGPLVVIEPGETYDPATDHVVVLGRRGASPASAILKDAASVVIDGEREPHWTWSAKSRHRLRLINIAPDDIWSVSLSGADGPVTWRPLTKDGAPVPAAEGAPRPARATIAVGETYDFEVETPAGRKALWLEVRGTDGKWQAQGRVLVR
jgi:FtsP/CotA-like multicopper oxidase with cupredoxin domain